MTFLKMRVGISFIRRKENVMIFKSHVQVEGVHDQNLPAGNVGNSVVIEHDNTAQYVTGLTNFLNNQLVAPQNKVNALQAALAALQP